MPSLLPSSSRRCHTPEPSLFLLGCALLMILWIRPAFAQADCTFADSTAVPDTLDPRGYYSLEVGNVWEYFNVQGGDVLFDVYSHHEIVGDTLIDGQTFLRRTSTRYYLGRDDTLHLWEEECCDVFAMDDTTLVYPGGSLGWERFNAPFKTCYQYSFESVNVGGGYQWYFEEGDTTLSAFKRFSTIGGGVGYAYGIGPVSGGADEGGGSHLRYAKIGKQEYGMPFAERYTIVATSAPEQEALPQEATLEVYPNPSHGATRFHFSIPQGGLVTLDVLDLLGRQVARPLNQAFLRAGTHTRAWPTASLANGSYLLRLRIDGRPVVTRTLTVLK